MEIKDYFIVGLRFTTNYYFLPHSQVYLIRGFRFAFSRVRARAVATASAAVPPLTSTTSATVGSSRFRAADPPGHRHDGWCAGLWLPRYDAVDPPAARGRRTEDQTTSLVLDEACDVLICR